ncbi:RNA recognition motif domain [Trypanosoma melophagium]|uniref:RNA recognition motif domain n=1 Tax=Trypanosoma melophagium TaxID=715481 RepID=UPI00351A3E0D|nr:RNA recognition motif domain [Trypanosoma melophagium]
MTRVYVGNIDKRATKEQLLEFLKPMEDTIEDSWLARRPPGFAFLTITPSQAVAFVEAFNGREFHGRALVVETSTTTSRRRERDPPAARSHGEKRRRRRSDSRGRHYSDRRRDRSRSRSRSRSDRRRRERSRERRYRRRSYSRSSSRSSRSS